MFQENRLISLKFSTRSSSLQEEVSFCQSSHSQGAIVLQLPIKRIAVCFQNYQQAWFLIFLMFQILDTTIKSTSNCPSKILATLCQPSLFSVIWMPWALKLHWMNVLFLLFVPNDAKSLSLTIMVGNQHTNPPNICRMLAYI